MVHIIYFFKELMTKSSGGTIFNGQNVNTWEYKGQMVCSFQGKEATPIISWLLKNIECSGNQYKTYGNPHVGITVYNLIDLLEEIDICLNSDAYNKDWVTAINISNFFPSNVRHSSETFVKPNEYLSILSNYKKVFEPLVWVDKDTKDYNNSGNWRYSIVSEYIV